MLLLCGFAVRNRLTNPQTKALSPQFAEMLSTGPRVSLFDIQHYNDITDSEGFHDVVRTDGNLIKTAKLFSGVKPWWHGREFIRLIIGAKIGKRH